MIKHSLTPLLVIISLSLIILSPRNVGAPSLPPIGLIPLLVVLTAIPLIIKRLRQRRSADLGKL